MEANEGLAQRYKEAKAYSELIASEGFLFLEDHLEKELVSTWSRATGAGYPTAEEERAAIAEARTKRQLIAYCRGKASKVPALEKQLEAAGIAYGAPESM